ncbi:CXXC zinc finger domain protein, partial [Teladorsagia circumcincta]
MRPKNWQSKNGGRACLEECLICGRCGVCRGCQCKPCGQCTYCQDSPQFGGPGVKKQSCIERRCLRVLENRLQRDAPTFKARVGCNQCEDCRMPDCQICLVCLDK